MWFVSKKKRATSLVKALVEFGLEIGRPSHVDSKITAQNSSIRSYNNNINLIPRIFTRRRSAVRLPPRPSHCVLKRDAELLQVLRVYGFVGERRPLHL